VRPSRLALAGSPSASKGTKGTRRQQPQPPLSPPGGGRRAAGTPAGQEKTTHNVVTLAGRSRGRPEEGGRTKEGEPKPGHRPAPTNACGAPAPAPFQHRLRSRAKWASPHIYIT